MLWKSLLLPAILLCATMSHADSPRPKLILDTDSANEIDDLYAIVRVLCQEKFDVLGLNATQWRHYLGDQNSVEASQSINEDLLRLMGRTDLKSHLGSVDPMGKPWGGSDAKDSDAAQFIIKQAKTMPEGEQLYVACLGATTNVASALKLAPEIAPKIRVYLMGFKYDIDTGVWNKSEFNVRRDLNAADFLLNFEGLDVHVMSATASRVYTFDRDETFRRNAALGPVGQYLTDRWKHHSPAAKTWVMWDLALIEAMLDPSFAKESQVGTPPENTTRQVGLYHDLKVQPMRDSYWDAVESGLKK